MSVPFVFPGRMPSSYPDPEQPANNESDVKGLTLLMLATITGVMLCLGFVAIMHLCKRRRVRTILLSDGDSSSTLPYYPDIARPPPAYFQNNDTISMKRLSQSQ